MVVKGIDSGARLPGPTSFLPPSLPSWVVVLQVVLTFFALVSSSSK